MADLLSLLSLFSFLLVYYGECSQQFLEECRSIGYTENLMCNSCNELKQFNLQKLEESCLWCCKDESVPETETERL